MKTDDDYFCPTPYITSSRQPAGRSFFVHKGAENGICAHVQKGGGMSAGGNGFWTGKAKPVMMGTAYDHLDQTTLQALLVQETESLRRQLQEGENSDTIIRQRILLAELNLAIRTKGPAVSMHPAACVGRFRQNTVREQPGS